MGRTEPDLHSIRTPLAQEHEIAREGDEESRTEAAQEKQTTRPGLGGRLLKVLGASRREKRLSSTAASANA
jgi:hypothetical protein